MSTHIIGLVPRWFATQPVDETFFDLAPVRLSETFEVPFAAMRVWEDLTGEAPLWWCKLLRSVTWTSPRPFGVGTTRTVRAVANASPSTCRFTWTIAIESHPLARLAEPVNRLLLSTLFRDTSRHYGSR